MKINPKVLIIKHSKIEQFLKIIGIALHTKLLKYRHLIDILSKCYFGVLFGDSFWGVGAESPGIWSLTGGLFVFAVGAKIQGRLHTFIA